MYVAVIEESTSWASGIEWFAGEEGKATMIVSACATEGIISAFKIAIIEYSILCSCKWTEV